MVYTQDVGGCVVIPSLDGLTVAMDSTDRATIAQYTEMSLSLDSTENLQLSDAFFFRVSDFNDLDLAFPIPLLEDNGEQRSFNTHYETAYDNSHTSGIAFIDHENNEIVEEVLKLLQACPKSTGKMREKKICSICKKEVYQLYKHNLIHNRQKRHRCMECNREFVQKSNLNRHVRDVHKQRGEPHKFCCKKCPYKTNRSDKFKNHLKKHKSFEK